MNKEKGATAVFYFSNERMFAAFSWEHGPIWQINCTLKMSGCRGVAPSRLEAASVLQGAQSELFGVLFRLLPGFK